MTVIPFPWRREAIQRRAAGHIAPDPLANLVFSELLSREAEFIAQAEAVADAGGPGKEETSLADRYQSEADCARREDR